MNLYMIAEEPAVLMDRLFSNFLFDTTTCYFELLVSDLEDKTSTITPRTWHNTRTRETMESIVRRKPLRNARVHLEIEDNELLLPDRQCEWILRRRPMRNRREMEAEETRTFVPWRTLRWQFKDDPAHIFEVRFETS